MNEWGRFALVGLFALIVGWITVRSGLNDIKTNTSDNVSYACISIGSAILLISAIFIVITVIVYCETLPTVHGDTNIEPVDVEYAGDDEYELSPTSVPEPSLEQSKTSTVKYSDTKRRK